MALLRPAVLTSALLAVVRGEPPLHVLDYALLVSGHDYTAEVAAAYSQDGLGILAVVGAPNASIHEPRSRLLRLVTPDSNAAAPRPAVSRCATCASPPAACNPPPAACNLPPAACIPPPQSRTLALAPPALLAKYERPELSYANGWSRGRESFKGVPDVTKGSWYSHAPEDDPAQCDPSAARYPIITGANLWPVEIVGADFVSVSATRSIGGRCCRKRKVLP